MKKYFKIFSAIITGLIFMLFGLIEQTRYLVYNMFPRLISYKETVGTFGDISSNPTIWPLVILFIIGFFMGWFVYKNLR